jgi:hypothetical protein
MKQPAGTAYEQLASLPSYETARVIGIEKSPVKSALFVLKVSNSDRV